MIDTPKERDYIFFFRSKRDPKKESFTQTEKKIYEAIADGGISAGCLAKDTGFLNQNNLQVSAGFEGQKTGFQQKNIEGLPFNWRWRKTCFVDELVQQIVEDAWNSTELVCKIPA